MARIEYLSVDEVAERFGVNPTTVYRLIRRGGLPAFKVGGQWRFSSEMLTAWVSCQVGRHGERASPPESTLPGKASDENGAGR